MLNNPKNHFIHDQTMAWITKFSLGTIKGSHRLLFFQCTCFQTLFTHHLEVTITSDEQKGEGTAMPNYSVIQSELGWLHDRSISGLRDGNDSLRDIHWEVDLWPTCLTGDLISETPSRWTLTSWGQGGRPLMGNWPHQYRDHHLKRMPNWRLAILQRNGMNTDRRVKTW